MSTVPLKLYRLVSTQKVRSNSGWPVWPCARSGYWIHSEVVALDVDTLTGLAPTPE